MNADKTYREKPKQKLYKNVTSYEDHQISFQTFFVWALLLIVHTWNSSPLRSNLLRLQCTYCIVPTTSGRPYQSPLVWACQGPSSNSQSANLPQIVYDKDGVVDWCIVLVEMLLTRFEECWPLPSESLPELPSNLNIVTLTLTLWPINCGVLTSFLLPHLSSSLTDSLPSLNLLCHLKTDARFMQDGRKAVWSIPYVSVTFFPSLKQFYCISFFLTSRLHFWNSPAVSMRL